jgi:putative aminopeptidase FrvX
MSKTKVNEEFLKTYLNAHSPVGFELEAGGGKIWHDYVSQYADKVSVDVYGNVYATYGEMDSARKTVVIEAHSDEIAWRINYIRPDGFVRVIRNGGSDTLIAPSKRVNIFGKNGVVRGIFGFPPIHDRQRNDKAGLNDIFLDLGCSSKEEVLELGVEVGQVAVFDDKLEILNDKFYVGRALDNRIGGVAIAEVLRKLYENEVELPYNLVVINAVQEEVGLEGSRMAAFNIKPDIAIVTDVTHATDSPAYNPERQGDIRAGQGAVLDHSPATHNVINRLVRKVAEKKNIPIQLQASSSGQGTDTHSFAYSTGGCATTLLSFPLRSMHTTVEQVHRDDVVSVIRIMYHTLKNISEDIELTYL